MGTKRKLDPLAVALALIDALKPEEQKTVFDYLRAKQPKAPRKKRASDPAPVRRLPDNPDDFHKTQKTA